MLSKIKILKSLFRCQPYYGSYFSTIDGKPCTSCGSKNFVMRFICGSCHILQDPSTNIQKLNYFQVFNMPLTFEVDKKKLEKEFKMMQMFFHPDKVNASPSGAQLWAEKYSATLNEAYSILKNDTSRAIYILKLKGYKFEEGNRMEDFEFMEQILEKRSIIEESNDQEEIMKIKKENDEVVKTYKKDIAESINKNDYAKAMELLKKFMYFDRIDEALSEWESRHKGHHH